VVEKRKVARAPGALESLVLSLAVAAVGCAVALRPAATADSVGLLLWLAVFAPAGGFLLAGLGVRWWPFAAAAPGVWMLALVAVDARSARNLPAPLWGALVFAGLFGLGWGAGRLLARGAPARALAGAGVVGLAAAALVALPTKGAPGGDGRAGEPWSPATARVLLDLSPATLLVESSGVDWMRHPAVYETVRADRFERLPYRGALAGPLALVVGCLVALGAGLATRSAGGAEE